MISPLISYDFAAKIIYDFAVTNLMFSPLFRMISPLIFNDFAAKIGWKGRWWSFNKKNDYQLNITISSLKFTISPLKNNLHIKLRRNRLLFWRLCLCLAADHWRGLFWRVGLPPDLDLDMGFLLPDLDDRDWRTFTFESFGNGAQSVKDFLWRQRGRATWTSGPFLSLFSTLGWISKGDTSVWEADETSCDRGQNSGENIRC